MGVEAFGSAGRPSQAPRSYVNPVATTNQRHVSQPQHTERHLACGRGLLYLSEMKSEPRPAVPQTNDEQVRARRNRLTGIGLMCAAVISFAFLDAIAKYLNAYMDTIQVVWARYTGGFLLTLLISNPISRPGLLRTSRPILQVVRALFLVGSTVSNFMAFRYLQLDQALSILFSTPFLVAILAGPLLGEWIGWRRWVAILVGFAGVLLVIPGFLTDIAAFVLLIPPLRRGIIRLYLRHIRLEGGVVHRPPGTDKPGRSPLEGKSRRVD